MADTDLVFHLPPSTNADLVFGDDGPDSNEIAVLLQPRLGRLQLRAIAAVSLLPIDVAARGQLRPLALRAAARYDNAVLRGPGTGVVAGWQRAVPETAATSSRFAASSPRSRRVAGVWASAEKCLSGVTVAQGALAHSRRATVAGWQRSQSRASRTATAWAALTALRHRRATLWQMAGRLATATAAAWQERTPIRQRRATRWQEGARLSRGVAAPFSPALLRPKSMRARWQNAWHPRPGVRPPRPPEPPFDPCYIPDPHLVFDARWDGSPNLLFVCERHDSTPPGPIVVPVLRTYIVVNDIQLVRVADGFVLEAPSFSVTFDSDSWTCAFQATLPASAMDDVMPAPDPVLLEARINGQAFRVLAESVTRTRRFGERRLQVSGRGWASELGAPQAPAGSWANTELRTAQQLAEEVLPTGWSLDWQLDDWLVPAGAWSFQGVPIDAVKRIAEAAGGYVRSARAARTLSVLHRYPVAPWEWGDETPDIILPADPVSVEGIEVVDKALYNAIYVSGESAGVLAHIKRSGTAGDLVAPMVTDALNTDPIVARQRGRAVLSDVGRQTRVSLELPILPEVGVIDLGAMIDFDDGTVTRRGLVRANSVSAAYPRVRQVVEVETHA
ncbi:hypothetical protein [Niveibacterium sp. SC-1]|uniref:hypothetical protein n=1 Tax=Niveibacterium sp. SC-1 TaxID=3135646 RepID=UPI00311EF8A6